MDLKLFYHAVPRLSLLRTLPLVVLLFACPSATTAQAQERVKNILFVFSWHQDMPWQRELEKGFDRQLSLSGKKPNLFYEYMDAGRFTGPGQLVNFRDYLEKNIPGSRWIVSYLKVNRLSDYCNPNPQLFATRNYLF